MLGKRRWNLNGMEFKLNINCIVSQNQCFKGTIPGEIYIAGVSAVVMSKLCKLKSKGQNL